MKMNKQIQQMIQQTEQSLTKQFSQVQEIVTTNQEKVLNAFQQVHVSESHFTPSTGYGYDDIGREKLEELYATVFRTEDALVRPQIVSGTHAITTCLFGVLRPGDELLYLTGRPYDTLEDVIGIEENVDGSLRDYGILYNELPLTDTGSVDFSNLEESINDRTKMVAIQRSKGYADRPSFTVMEIKEMIDEVRKIKPDAIIFIDNCYGEFVETYEPSEVGADLMAGSLIKNPGAGIAKTGGYIVGKEKLVNKCANWLVAPGLGKETGASLYSLHEMFQGFFLAPHVVGEALKGAYFTSQLLSDHGYKTEPTANDVGQTSFSQFHFIVQRK